MKQFIKNLFSFLCFAGVIYFGLVLIWATCFDEENLLALKFRKAVAGHSFSRFKEARTTKNVDILFLGSSHTYRGFDPRIFQKENYSTFNLGSSSQSPFQTEVLINRYLKSLNPKLVIYEVYPETLFSDGIESSIDLIANDKPDLNSLKMTLKLNSPLVYNTFLLSIWKNYLIPDRTIETLHHEKDRYVNGGYVETSIVPFFNKNIKKTTLNLSKNQFLQFDKNLKLIKDENIPYILVLAPITKKLYSSVTNWPLFEMEMKKRGNFYNFNPNHFEIDSLYFYDIDHLRQKGTEYFNKSLISILKTQNFEK